MSIKEKPIYQSRKAYYHAFVDHNISCRMHLHRHAELTYMINGEQEFIIDGITYLLKGGDLILTFPYQVHSVKTPDYSTSYTGIFDPHLTDDFTSYLNNYRFEEYLFHNYELQHSSLDALEELKKTAVTKSYKKNLIPYLEKGYLNVVLADLFSRHTLAPCPIDNDAFVLTRFFQYIEENLCNDLSLDAIAPAIGTNKYALSRIISKNLNGTILDCVLIRRLNKARYLLQSTNMPVESIAKETGFHSSRTFYRNFQKAFQKTPLQYRQKKSWEEIEKEKTNELLLSF